MARRRSSVRIGVTGLGEREELTPGVFINTHYRGCTPGFIHTEEGIVLVDTPLIPKQALDWREQIEEEYVARRALELFEVIGEEGVGRFEIDKRIPKIEYEKP